MTQINDITDLVQVLRDHPEWRDTVRGLIVGEELATLPKRVENLEAILAQFMTATNKNFELVHERLAGLETGTAELREEISQLDTKMERGFAQVNGRMDNAFGANYEVKVARNIASIARQQLQLRRPRVLASSTTGTAQEWLDLLEDAQDQGSITSRQVDQVLAADVVLKGQHPDTGPDSYVIIELSITMGDDDVARAHDRATIIKDATRGPVLAAVICANADPERTSFAQELGVLIAQLPE